MRNKKADEGKIILDRINKLNRILKKHSKKIKSKALLFLSLM